MRGTFRDERNLLHDLFEDTPELKAAVWDVLVWPQGPRIR